MLVTATGRRPRSADNRMCLVKSLVTAVLPPPGQHCGTVCLNSFGNRSWKRSCLVIWTVVPCLWTLRALTRNLFNYLLTYLHCLHCMSWRVPQKEHERVSETGVFLSLDRVSGTLCLSHYVTEISYLYSLRDFWRHFGLYRAAAHSDWAPCTNILTYLQFSLENWLWIKVLSRCVALIFRFFSIFAYVTYNCCSWVWSAADWTQSAQRNGDFCCCSLWCRIKIILYRNRSQNTLILGQWLWCCHHDKLIVRVYQGRNSHILSYNLS